MDGCLDPKTYSWRNMTEQKKNNVFLFTKVKNIPVCFLSFDFNDKTKQFIIRD